MLLSSVRENQALFIAAAEVSQKGIKDQVTNFGSNQEGRAYHFLMHTAYMRSLAIRAGTLAVSNLRIHPNSVPLIGISGAYHDIRQGGSNPEEASATRAITAMMQHNINNNQDYRFSYEQMASVREMILGTKVTVRDGMLIAESTKPDASYESKLLSDSDLGAFGAELNILPPFMHGFLKETRGVKLKETLEQTPQEFSEFYEFQSQLFANTTYQTEEVGTVLSPHINRNAELLHEASRKLLDRSMEYEFVHIDKNLQAVTALGAFTLL